MNSTIPYPYASYLYPTTIPSWIGSGIGLFCGVIFIIESIKNENKWYATLSTCLLVPLLYALLGTGSWSIIYTPLWFYSKEHKIAILYTSYTLEIVFILGMYYWLFTNTSNLLFDLALITSISIALSGMAMVFYGFILGLLVNTAIHYYQASLVVLLLLIIPGIVIGIYYLKKRWTSNRNNYSIIEPSRQEVNEDA